MGGRWRRAASACSALALAALAGCSNPMDPGPVPMPGQRTELVFGVYGTRAEIAAYRAAAQSFNATSTSGRVVIRAWRDHDTAIQAMQREGADRPDVFMVSRRDLAWLEESDANLGVDELLDSRGVTFSDDYSRDALEAFSGDRQLQCMPYAISPMVLYYNTALVDFDKMANQELDVPTRHDRWTFAEFTAAAQYADRPGRGIGGVYIDPTLRGLAPFIYSGGGQLFDDPAAPTSLAFSDGDTQAALEETLAVLRDPDATLSSAQLDQASGLEWFKRGRLGMIAGFRDLVPQLRRVDGLDFDVIAMPTLDDARTIGDVTGLCISSSTDDQSAAADFLVHVLSQEEVAKVARTGYVVPASLVVSQSDDFLQPDKRPVSAEVFNTSLRTIVTGPLINVGPELEAAVQPYLMDMMTDPVLDLPLLGEEIDTASQPILAPPETPTGTPSEPTESDTAAR